MDATHIDSRDVHKFVGSDARVKLPDCHLDGRAECSHSVLITPIFDESQDLIYRIELWTQDDQHVETLLAKCARLAVAYGALEAAIAEYPGRNVTLPAYPAIRRYFGARSPQSLTGRIREAL